MPWLEALLTNYIIQLFQEISKQFSSGKFADKSKSILWLLWLLGNQKICRNFKFRCNNAWFRQHMAMKFSKSKANVKRLKVSELYHLEFCRKLKKKIKGITLDTGCKLYVQKTFTRHLGCLLNLFLAYNSSLVFKLVISPPTSLVRIALILLQFQK